MPIAQNPRVLLKFTKVREEMDLPVNTASRTFKPHFHGTIVYED